MTLCFSNIVVPMNCASDMLFNILIISKNAKSHNSKKFEFGWNSPYDKH